MGHISGKAGQVDTGSAVSGIKSWTLDYIVDALETTDFADAGVRSYVGGCSGWSGSFEGYKEGTPQAITGNEITLTLYEETGAGNWTGNAILTAVHATTSFDGVVSYSYDFQGTKGLTEAKE